MAYKSNFGDSYSNEEEGKMAWDLRQIFAKDVLGKTLMRIQDARLANDYPNWFKLLKRDLATEIYKNLEPEENDEIDKEIQKVKKVITDNVATYTKKSNNSEQHQRLEDALISLEKKMLRAMQLKEMFGAKGEQEEGF